MKIQKSKRSQLRIIGEFRGILNGFPNLGYARLSAACLVEATSDNDLKSESTSMSNTKKEIMSLRLDVGMIFSLHARIMSIV
jgi:hypothetical protein